MNGGGNPSVKCRQVRSTSGVRVLKDLLLSQSVDQTSTDLGAEIR